MLIFNRLSGFLLFQRFRSKPGIVAGFTLDTVEQRQALERQQRVQILLMIVLGYALFISMWWMQSGKFGRLEQLQTVLADRQQQWEMLRSETARLDNLYNDLRDGQLSAETLAFLSFRQQSLIADNQQVVLLPVAEETSGAGS